MNYAWFHCNQSSRFFNWERVKCSGCVILCGDVVCTELTTGVLNNGASKDTSSTFLTIKQKFPKQRSTNIFNSFFRLLFGHHILPKRHPIFFLQLTAYPCRHWPMLTAFFDRSWNRFTVVFDWLSISTYQTINFFMLSLFCFIAPTTLVHWCTPEYGHENRRTKISVMDWTSFHLLNIIYKFSWHFPIFYQIVTYFCTKVKSTINT